MPRIIQRHESRSLALIRPPASPELSLACPVTSLGRGLMPLIVDDAFYEFAREHRLPDCSVSFLMRAGSWSARNSRSGFVPATMLADFSDDPDQVKRTLCAAGLLERVDGGWRIAGGHGITVVNAVDVAAKAAEAEAVAETERSAKSAGGQHGNHRRWHEKRGIRVPGCEFCGAAGTETAAPAKRTSHSDRMRLGSDSDATPIDRSKSDLDLSPVSPKQQGRRPTAREGDPSPGSHAFRIAIIAKVAAAARVDISPETADAIASDVLGGKKHVGQRLLYVLTAIDNEADPFGRWLAGYQRPARKHAVPDWCGKCDKTDRSIWDEQAGGLRWCPDCSPRTLPRWEAHAA